MSKPAPPLRHVKAPIRTLNGRHRVDIQNHLLALTEGDRYLRFGYAASDEQVQRYVASLRFDCDEVFGIFNWRMQLIGISHLAYLVEGQGQFTAEFGVSVARHARGRGYGQQLFDRAVKHARNEGVDSLIIHTLSENAAMLSIARKGGAAVVREGSESRAHLQLPPADFESSVTAMLEEQAARSQYLVKFWNYHSRLWWQRQYERAQTLARRFVSR